MLLPWLNHFIAYNPFVIDITISNTSQQICRGDICVPTTVTQWTLIRKQFRSANIS